MENECFRTGATIKEDFRILVKCEVEMQLPKDIPLIMPFYQKMGDAAIRWSREQLGEKTRKEYASLPDLWAKARFLPVYFRLQGAPAFEDADHLVMVCHSVLSQGNERLIRRSAQVWNKREGTVLSDRLVLRRFCKGKCKKPRGFHADGCYPCGGEMIFFRNPTAKAPFSEQKIKFFQSII